VAADPATFASVAIYRQRLDRINQRVEEDESDRKRPEKESRNTNTEGLGTFDYVGTIRPAVEPPRVQGEGRTKGPVARPDTSTQEHPKGSAAGSESPAGTSAKGATSWDDLVALVAQIESDIIGATRKTERTAVHVGIAFYGILLFGVVLAAVLLNSPLATISSLAIGTGGAVAYIQPFQTTLTTYLRTDRMLQNIQAGWQAEIKRGPSNSKELLKQVDAFLEAIAKMPSAYAGESSGSK
jgi:hypothetical protein